MKFFHSRLRDARSKRLATRNTNSNKSAPRLVKLLARFQKMDNHAESLLSKRAAKLPPLWRLPDTNTDETTIGSSASESPFIFTTMPTVIDMSTPISAWLVSGYNHMTVGPC